MSWRRRTSAAAAALALIAVVGAAPASAAPNTITVRNLTDAVTPDGVMNHLEALQAVADANGGDRAAGRPGYRASVDYVVAQLRGAGYAPAVQEFMFAYTEENSQLRRISPLPRTFVNGVDFLRNRFDSGTHEGTATGTLVPVGLVINPSAPPNSNTSGCESADFAGFPAGAIALMQRGTCGFAIKSLNAQAAGASAVIIMNEGQPGRTGLTNMIGDATGLTIPAIFTTFDAGFDLSQTPGATVTVTVDFVAETRAAYNVLAETAAGNPDNVVMAGAHLDSVQAGAGIQDNGSGSAALLETAIKMARAKPANKVRFAWWGAEESGLLGSRFYVAGLSAAAAEDIALYLNFDMIASPNYTFGIYDGDNSGGTAAPGFIPPGSAQIEDAFEAFFTSRGEPFTDTEFSGRSDYGPFIAIGIPAGGLFTGAEVPKTVAEEGIFGGVVGAQLDPCYHQFCDNLRGDGQNAALFDQLRQDYDLVGNVNMHALDVNSDALAATTLGFAYDSSSVNAVAGKRGKSLGLYKFGDPR
jgi:Zn-dependent M28 family amino/carboxypeptidase